MGSIEQPKFHAIFVSYPLQGHVIPSVHLAIKLASKGFTVTFVNTESIHHQITKADAGTPTTDADIFANARKSGLDIRYHIVSDGLPLKFDRSLNHDQFMASLYHVFSAHVEEIVQKLVSADPSINCLIADTFFVWPSKISKKFNLFYISYWTEQALVFSLYYHAHLLKENGHYGFHDNREDTITYIPGVAAIEPTDLMSYLQASDTTTVVHQLIFAAFQDARGADFVLCNTVHELEPDTISALERQKPFYAIGPVFPVGFTKTCVATSLWAESNCTEWLDSKPNGSVLYVSFGSYAHVTKHDLIEIANGLLLSGVNFVWVLRPDIVSSDDQNPLPKNFFEEMGDRGKIVQWCQQLKILSHPSIGAFFTHCGWNSTMEGIWCGVPFLCFPLLTDQFTNRKLIVDDWKIGLDIDWRRPVERKDVSEKVKRLMSGDDEFKDKIKEAKRMVRSATEDGGSSEKDLDTFIKDLTAKFNGFSVK